MTRRIFTAVFGCLGLLIIFVVGGGFFLYTGLTHAQIIRTPVEFQTLELYTWARIDLSDQTQCSDASDYRIYARRGESDNVLVHFVGGGAAWDAETSSNPIAINDFDGFYFAAIWDIVRAILDGIFSTRNPDNPFRDWNVVYIPYCTADFHIGNAHPEYILPSGQTFTLHHNGYRNAREALDWIFQTFPTSPEKWVISGESAGAFGSLFWTPTIAAHYPDSDIYHIGDGSFIETEQWSHIITVWHADTQTLGFAPSKDLIGGVYLGYAKTTPPNVTYLHINTLYDETLMYFNAYLNQDSDLASYPQRWSSEMRTSMQVVDDSDLPYFYFLTDYNQASDTLSTPHTSISFNLFYAIEEDGVRLSEWVRRIVIDGERFSVGTGFMP
jgi:hypothetical protein